MFKSVQAISKNLQNAQKFNFSQYDVVVIGGGPGGYVSAIKAA
eukprot:CAMPEP_0204821386 /NCGR_PEP_ID=MMETSP1018-20131115/13392_1 /ASSEMBLY_ACC=CAM_ASM_000518 /TAXON_ID=46462 /ORGANISM="Anophryoides haemophila, Strain AH6" /LENGTH=42 /DNA_ID= /DNA_START= /DNA_END= /DNA_ORIENTATION=